jgi:hypothetical protein
MRDPSDPRAPHRNAVSQVCMRICEVIGRGVGGSVRGE